MLRIAFAGIAGAFTQGCGEPDSLNKGDPAPSFSLVDAQGRPVRFGGVEGGPPTTIRFWADWCAYCMPEMSALEPVVARLRASRLAMLAVNVGQDPARVRSFADRIGVTYPVLVDESGSVARAYRVRALPTTFFVGGDGKIRNKLVGEADAATFERLARELLPGDAPERPR